ncbi:MAG TPA: hypothetical protein DEV81_01475 [Cyanobacteria bacterium UBA11049]|nr:hypothetical protein [Cyanobacteria bacterium UBA11049]
MLAQIQTLAFLFVLHVLFFAFFRSKFHQPVGVTTSLSIERFFCCLGEGFLVYYFYIGNLRIPNEQ